MTMSAIISPCGNYRLELRRQWDEALPLLVVCMLNPSTADAERNDPTISALIHFAKLWGYGGLYIVNLYAYRTSSPDELFKGLPGVERVGPGNEHACHRAIRYAAENGGQLLVAWGNHGNDRASYFSKRVWSMGVRQMCLGTTLNGSPKHPMARGKHRIQRDQQPILWRAA